MTTAAAPSRRPSTFEEAGRLPLPKLDASSEDKADYVVGKWTIQDDHYRGLYRLWVKVLFFLVGKHWLKWNEAMSVYDPDTDVPAWRQQPVTNITFAIFRKVMAKMTKNRPVTEVIPPSGDSDDKESARLAEAILEYLWLHLKTPQKVVRALGWFICTGNVFLDADWDEDGGAVKPRTTLVEVPNPDHDPNDPLSDETMDVECPCDEDGEPHMDGDAPDFEHEPEFESEGEVEIGIDDPFSVRFNPDATDADDATEWMIGKLWSTQDCADYFNVDVADLAGSTTDSNDMRSEFDDVMSRAAAAGPDPFRAPQLSSIGTDQSEAIGPRTLVIYYYRKPEPKRGWPHGRHYIVAGRKKVWPPEPGEEGNKKKEYPNGEAPLPFGFWPPRVPLIDTPIPGQPQGIGLLTQVVPLNEQLNILDGKIAEYHVTMAMGGIWFVRPEDRGIVITSEPGQVKISKGMGVAGQAGAPYQARMSALPAAIYNERNVIMQKVQTVANIGDVDLSQRPPGVTAGRAMLVLQEASDETVATAITALENAIAELDRRKLVIVQQKYTEDRTIQIRGEKGKTEFRSFRGADLRQGLNVRVQAGSMYPWSKTAQWDTKLSVLQSLPPQALLKPDGTFDRQTFERYLDSGVSGLKAFDSDEDPNAVEIEMEHSMFERYDPTDPSTTNEVPQIGFWQNHAEHWEGHTAFMKRDRARFNRWHPAAQKAFLDHMGQTLQTIEGVVDKTMPAGGAAVDPNADPNAEAAPSAGEQPPPGDEAPPDEGAPSARPMLQLRHAGGSSGAPGIQSAGGRGGPARLTRGDRAAAGQ